jgi:hypothetical protein
MKKVNTQRSVYHIERGTQSGGKEINYQGKLPQFLKNMKPLEIDKSWFGDHIH